MDSFFHLSPEVRLAFTTNKPVVALESTIITHGMPYPENIQTAREVEDIVRQKGAVPATVCIMEGKIKVGLSQKELEVLASSDQVEKVSRRDISRVVASGGMGATTVAATMIVAARVGIKVFVTGGIGGVHRGVEDTMDISADLEELANSSVAVVCAGVKSILDIPKTLEVLETKGVPVATYGSWDFPGFYCTKTGCASPSRVDDLASYAKELKVKWELGIEGGALLALPIGKSMAIDGKKIELIIQGALEQAQEQKVSGKDVTPFLLSKVAEVTEGASLQANIALIKANAALGAELSRYFVH